MSFKAKVKRAIESLRGLDEGWAGGDMSEYISDRAIEAAIEFVDALPDDASPPLVQPMLDGSVCLEWKSPVYLAIVFDPDGEVRGEEWWDQLVASVPRLNLN